jgi:site-specific recombinase XerC
MHLPLLKALIAVISASVLAIGVALASAGNAHHAYRGATTTKARTLETDGLQFLGQLAAGNVKPDPALKQSWIDDVTAVAHSLGLSDSALAQQLSAGRSLAQIAASRGMPASTPTNALLRHLRDDLHRAEQDQAISPTVANSLLDAVGTALGSS